MYDIAMLVDDIMNNTKTLAIVAILTAAILVVGVTFAATTTPSAFAAKKGPQNKKQDPKGKDNGNDGNTVTIQANKQKGIQSGFDNSFQQDATNEICTHPGENQVMDLIDNQALCLSEVPPA